MTSYLYRADGVKVKKLFGDLETHHLDGFQYKSTKPSESSVVGTDISVIDDPSEVAEIKLRIIPTSEGYYDALLNQYIYNYTDHLGNVRLSYTDTNKDGVIQPRQYFQSQCEDIPWDPFNPPSCISIWKPGEIVEINTYYPFGLLHNYTATTLNAYQYKYNGKELQETGMYDYGARMYMPDLGRWGVVDPLAEKYVRMSSYNYTFNDPINVIDPDGKDGIRIIDKENKTITIRAVYYVQTQTSSFKNFNGKQVTVNGYSSDQVSSMNKDVNSYLNNLKSKVSDGDYSGYTIKYDLKFKEGGDLDNTEKLAKEEKQHGLPIGNSIRNGDSESDPVYFKKTENSDGSYSFNGGVTEERKNIIMNTEEGDNLMNRVHEIFHTFGFSHPKGTGGSEGIMKYPPANPSQKEVNTISTNPFLPSIEKKINK